MESVLELLVQLAELPAEKQKVCLNMALDRVERCFEYAETLVRDDKGQPTLMLNAMSADNRKIFKGIMSKDFINWIGLELQYPGSLLYKIDRANSRVSMYLCKYSEGNCDPAINEIIQDKFNPKLFNAALGIPFINDLDGRSKLTAEEIEKEMFVEDKEPLVSKELLDLLTQIRNEQGNHAVQNVLRASLKAGEVHKDEYTELQGHKGFDFLKCLTGGDV